MCDIDRAMDDFNQIMELEDDDVTKKVLLFLKMSTFTKSCKLPWSRVFEEKVLKSRKRKSGQGVGGQAPKTVCSANLKAASHHKTISAWDYNEIEFSSMIFVITVCFEWKRDPETKLFMLQATAVGKIDEAENVESCIMETCWFNVSWVLCENQFLFVMSEIFGTVL